MKFTALAAALLLSASGLSAANAPAPQAKTPGELAEQRDAIKDFDAYVQLKKYREALDVFERAKLGNPQTLQSFNLPALALCYERLGERREALAVIEAVRESLRASRERAAARAKSGKPADSIGTFQALLRAKLEEQESKMSDAEVKMAMRALIAELPTKQGAPGKN